MLFREEKEGIESTGSSAYPGLGWPQRGVGRSPGLLHGALWWRARLEPQLQTPGRHRRGTAGTEANQPLSPSGHGVRWEGHGSPPLHQHTRGVLPAPSTGPAGLLSHLGTSLLPHMCAVEDKRSEGTAPCARPWCSPSTLPLLGTWTARLEADRGPQVWRPAFLSPRESHPFPHPCTDSSGSLPPSLQSGTIGMTSSARTHRIASFATTSGSFSLQPGGHPSRPAVEACMGRPALKDSPQGGAGSRVGPASGSWRAASVQAEGSAPRGAESR